MTREQVLDIWSSRDSVWTRWVKPVLFSFMHEGYFRGKTHTNLVEKWSVPHQQEIAIVADMPGAEGVEVGLALALSGYRPIPLYNACPFVLADPGKDELIGIFHEPPPRPLPAPPVVNSTSIMHALYFATKELEEMKLKADAPPVFLLDASRRGDTYFPTVGSFDNRSVVSSLDVPSGAFLKEHQINRVVVVQAGTKTESDLLEILLAWQSEGLAISFQSAWRSWAPEKKHLKPEAMLVRLWRNMQILMGYRSNISGGYGRIVRGSGG